MPTTDRFRVLNRVSTGTDHSAGSVPSCEGSGDGSEAPPPLVGGLADSGPCPAQPRRGGPGEYGWQYAPNENKLEYGMLPKAVELVSN